MIDIPRPGNPFHEAYLVAAAQCGQLPITEISDTNENCIVTSIAWIAMRDQVRADRSFVMEAGLPLAALLVIIAVVRSRRNRVAR
jgi:hypothetical protein